MSQSHYAETIVVAMSGGVDSSTAAALLHEQGHRVIGLTMQLWNQRRLAGNGSSRHRCCSIDDVYDARRVAEHLGLPYYVVNFEAQFEQTVVRPFVSDYLAGRTPIPCTLCNNHVKFDQLLRTARQIGAQWLATGHYARIRFDSATGRYRLLRAVDKAKDQSYFLFGLKQEQMARVLFPLGEMTKAQVRDQAARARLPVAAKPESQEICFVPSGDYVQFIEAYLDEQGAGSVGVPGDIVTTDGKVLGRHQGLHRYTVGQRRGLGVAVGRPLYVAGMDRVNNQLIVAEDCELRASTCQVRDVNWISVVGLDAPMQVHVKIRNRHEPAVAQLEPLDDSVRVRFAVPQRAVTPGQAAVFYSGDVVVGGGWIA